MARRTLNRHELRRGGSRRGQGYSSESRTEAISAKGEPTLRSKPAANPRMRIVWAVCDVGGRTVASFDYVAKAEAEALIAQLKARGKGMHFSALVQRADSGPSGTKSNFIRPKPTWSAHAPRRRPSTPGYPPRSGTGSRQGSPRPSFPPRGRTGRQKRDAHASNARLPATLARLDCDARSPLFVHENPSFQNLTRAGRTGHRRPTTQENWSQPLGIR